MIAKRLVALALGTTLAVAACGNSSTGTGSSSTTAAGSSGTAGAAAPKDLGVAKLQGLNGGTGAVALKVIEVRGLDKKHGFKGEFQYVAADAATQNFLTGQSDVSFDMGPPDLAVTASKGRDVVAMGPAISNVVKVIVPKDSTITKIEDVKGKKFGQYGDDSTGTMYLTYMLDRFHQIDYRKDFTIVTQAPPALIPLLEQKQVDAVLNFQPQLASAATTMGSKVIYDPDAEWRKATGGRLWSTLQVTTRAWVKKNPDLAKAVHKAWCEAADWMNNNLDALTTEQAYVDIFKQKPEVLKTLAAQMKEDAPFFGCAWDQKLVSGLEDLLTGISKQRVLFDKVPANLFQTPDEILK